MLKKPLTNETPEWNEQKENEYQAYMRDFHGEQQGKLEKELLAGKEMSFEREVHEGVRMQHEQD